MGKGGTSLPENGGAAAGSNGVDRKEDATPIRKGSNLGTITVLVAARLSKELRPHRPLTPVRPPFTPHRQTIVQEAGVRQNFVLGNLVGGAGEKSGIFGASTGFFDEARRDNSRVVTAFERVSFFARAGVAVEIFLGCDSIEKNL